MAADTGKKFVAEMVGTFGLVFAGTTAIIANELTGAVTHVGIALSFGLALMAMIYAFGHISGGHFNPAVSIGMWAAGELPSRSVLTYVLAQLVGATLASLIALWTYGNVAALGTTLPSGSVAQSFVVEVVLTFFLVGVVAMSAAHVRAAKGFAGLAIGITLVFSALAGGPISGASLNPARSIGPALVSGTFDHLWLYIVAPIIGGLIAALVYRYLKD